MLKGYLSDPADGSRSADASAFSYTEAERSQVEESRLAGFGTMVERRIKPYFEEQAQSSRRAEQTRIYRRNQALGMVMLAAVILIFWLFRTNPKWIFPPGWWRL